MLSLFHCGNFPFEFSAILEIFSLEVQLRETSLLSGRKKESSVKLESPFTRDRQDCLPCEKWENLVNIRRKVSYLIPDDNLLQ